MQSTNEQLEKFKKLVEEINVGMMITVGENGKLQSRPMGNARVDDDGSIWFFTNEHSGKVGQISSDNDLYFTYASPSKSSYVSFNAIAEFSDDKALIDELWTPAMNAWFKEGKDDPSILLIHATPIEAEYWDNTSNKVLMFFQMVKAAVTGKFEGGDHGTIKL